MAKDDKIKEEAEIMPQETTSNDLIAQIEETENTKSGTSNGGRKKAKPVRTFPQYPLADCIEISNVIVKQNAGNPWSPEQVGEAMGTSYQNNAFFYLTSASRDYGLTIGTSRAKTIELTPLGRKIAIPASPEDESEGIFEAFSNIDIFKKVYEYYNGGVLPEDKYLRNTLKEIFKVDQNFHEEFIDIFKKNLEYLDKLNAVDRTGTYRTENTTLLSNMLNGKSSEKRMLFVIMPFIEKSQDYPKGYFDEVYSSLIVPAAAEAGFTAYTAQRSGSDIIHSTIISDIYNSELILTDLTEHNPNVLFELGLAIAFKKKVALIRAKGTKPIFDVDNLMRVYDYDKNLWKSTIERDIPNLAKHIEATIQTDGSMYLDILLKK